jgi:hypothetical protein
MVAQRGCGHVRLSGAGNPACGLAFSQSSRLKAAAENHRAAQRNKDLVIQASACGFSMKPDA